MLQIEPAGRLVLGLVSGVILGFLLQKGGLTRYRVIVGQFLLRDFTVIKAMLTAIIVGGVGVWALYQTRVVDMHVKSALLSANIIGGVIFGIGMGLLGYCPGTGVGAMADRSRHAIFGVIGMLVGAALYAESQPWLTAHVLRGADLGPVTFPDLTGVSPWWYLAALAVAAALLFRWFGRIERRAATTAAPQAPSPGE
jgi:uncharacterized membrane protein YedE/YeeE